VTLGGGGGGVGAEQHTQHAAEPSSQRNAHQRTLLTGTAQWPLIPFCIATCGGYRMTEGTHVSAMCQARDARQRAPCHSARTQASTHLDEQVEQLKRRCIVSRDDGECSACACFGWRQAKRRRRLRAHLSCRHNTTQHATATITITITTTTTTTTTTMTTTRTTMTTTMTNRRYHGLPAPVLTRLVGRREEQLHQPRYNHRRLRFNLTRMHRRGLDVTQGRGQRRGDSDGSNPP
jgi:hypothetical protein